MRCAARDRSLRQLTFLVTLCAIGVAAITGAAAAPSALNVTFRSPSRAQVGELIVISGLGLVAPLTVQFSDGAQPTIAGTTVLVDTARGIAAVRVPAGAKTGYLKVTANGADAPLYWFRIEAGTFTPGSATVTGHVTSGGVGVANVKVILLHDTGCDNSDVYDVATTDASGAYTLIASAGSYGVFVWPAPASGLASTSSGVTLGATPVTKDIALVAGTTVTGTLVDALTSAPLANHVVALEGDVYDQTTSDASGNFTFHAMPQSARLGTGTAPGDYHVAQRIDITVGAGPSQPLGQIPLQPGVAVTGFVTSQGGGSPISGSRVHAWLTSGTGNNPTYDADVRGDGSYELIVPPNATYDLEANCDDDSSFVDQRATSIAIGATTYNRSWTLHSAAIITGTVRDAGSNAALAQFEMQYGNGSGPSLGWARTCTDGSYHFRVDPGSGVVVSNGGNETGYAVQWWNGNASGTYYSCEAQTITPATPGSIVPNVDFRLVPEAAVTGHFYTATSGCTATTIVSQLTIDDGTTHSCSLGNWDWNAAPGTYRVFGLPPSSVVPSLRVCTYPNGYTAQCYSQQPTSNYTAIHVAGGATASNIDFCLGSRPTHTITRLDAHRIGTNVEFSWTASTDLFHDHYVLRGSTSARPGGGGPGSFPSNPSFGIAATTNSLLTTVPSSLPYTFYLLTDAGQNGDEGPSGSYGN